jgi:hypothetical protein
MGLLFGDTYITKNYNGGGTDPALAKATQQLACATEKVAESNQNIADAINEDKVTIPHSRYAELVNKRRLLNKISGEIVLRLSVLFEVTQSEDYKRYREMYIMGSFDKVLVISDIFKDDKCVGMDFKQKIACLYEKSKDREPSYFDYKTMEDLGYDVIQIGEPLYMKESDGEAKITGSEYRKLLREEDKLDNVFIPALEVLPNVMFDILNCDRKYGDTENNDKMMSSVAWVKQRTLHFVYDNKYDNITFISNGYSWRIDYNKSIVIKKL